MKKIHLQKIPTGFFNQLIFWCVLTGAALVMVLCATPWVILEAFNRTKRIIKYKLNRLRKR